MAINVTTSSFETEVEKSDLPVLVDFWASWCGPCRMLAPTIEMLSKEVEGKVKVCKVNVDDEEELARKFGIMTIPSLLVFVGGKVIAQEVGVKSVPQLKKMLGL